MDKVIERLRAIVAAILAWPVIAPLLELLTHRSVLVLLAGLAGYALVPTIPFLASHPEWIQRLGDFIFYGSLILSGRFSIQGIIEARGGLPATLDAYLRALLGEILSPTPELVTTSVKLAPAPTEAEHVG